MPAFVADSIQIGSNDIAIAFTGQLEKCDLIAIEFMRGQHANIGTDAAPLGNCSNSLRPTRVRPHQFVNSLQSPGTAGRTSVWDDRKLAPSNSIDAQSGMGQH